LISINYAVADSGADDAGDAPARDMPFRAARLASQSLIADLTASSASTTKKKQSVRINPLQQPCSKKKNIYIYIYATQRVLIYILEQCNLTGGRLNSFAISVFFNLMASQTFIPLIFSVAKEDDAMADPHPNVLNLTSWISPVASSTMIWSWGCGLFGWFLVTFGLEKVRERLV
jgi:hypothetical protein